MANLETVLENKFHIFRMEHIYLTAFFFFFIICFKRSFLDELEVFSIGFQSILENN